MIEAAIQNDLPTTPPMHFERRVDLTSHDTRSEVPSKTMQIHVGRGFWEEWSSSSRQGTLENLSRIWLESPSATSSSTQIVDSLWELLSAEKRADSVNVLNAAENVFELRRLTGFTWGCLADLLNVERRSLNNWVKGSEIRACNQEHIAETLSVLRFADRGSAEENAGALYERRFDISPFEAIKARQYLNARQYMGHGLTRTQHSWPLASDWTGEFQPMLSHDAADGTEAIERLSDEPKPTGRKRRIKRG